MNQNRCALLSVIGILFSVNAPTAFAQSGQISLTIDATLASEKIVRTRESIPVKPGPFTLYYPKWIPGEHGPDGPIGNVTGLKFTANGKTIRWQRDLLDNFTFHVDVPAGADHLDVAFDYLEPGTSATDKLLVIEWNQNVLYPAGPPVSKIIFKPTLILPVGWKFGTPEHVESQSGNQVSFAAVALDRLVDSPVITGQYYRAIDITPPGEPIHHEIDIVADSEAALEMSPETQKGMRLLCP